MKITKKIVDALAPGDVVWQQNFGVRGNADGTKSFLLDYRVGRRRRRLTVGTFGSPWTVETARKRANELLGDILRDGADPLATKTATRTAPTIRDLAERFLAEHAEVKCKPRTAALYQSILKNNVGPALGHLAVRDVTRADVSALHHRLRGTPAHGNRVLLLLSKVFNLAERWGWRPEGAGNPARLVERFREAPRHRYLSLEEFKRLGEALAAAESDSPIAVAAIRLLIYTGARREEILTAKWEYVDRASAALRLPTSKTGFKVIQLNAPALAVLASLPRLAKNPYILPGVRTGQHAVNITKVWYAVREAAGIKDVRLHDLRHSHASVGAAAGLSLPIIGGLLGHAAPATTARYAHLSADPLKRASETVGERLAAAMGTR